MVKTGVDEMKILRHYLWKNLLISMLITMGTLAAIQVMIQFITALSSIGKGDFGWMTALYCVILKLPFNMYELFPVMGFMGALIGLGRLASNNEIMIMLAAGMSKFQLLRTVICFSIVLASVVFFVGERFGSQLLYKAEQIQYQSTHVKSKPKSIQSQNASIPLMRSVWLRQDKRFIYLDKVYSDYLIQGLRIFTFNPQGRLLSVLYAKQAHLMHGFWHCSDVTKWNLHSGDVSIINRHRTIESFYFNLDQQQKLKKNRDENDFSIPSLFQMIHYLHRIGFESKQYQYALWHRLLQPVAAIIMICLAIPFVFGSLRSVSLGQRLLTGIMVGFIFYMINNFMGEVGLIFNISPLLSAALPCLVFMLVYLILVKRLET